MAKGELGYTGLTVFAGQVQDEFLRELRGKEGFKRYDEMRRNSAPIAAMLYYHEMAVRKVSWNFVSDIEGDPRIDFLNEARAAMSQSWNDVISEWLSFIWAGYSISYPLYKRDASNRLIWDAFSPRKQSTVFQWQMNYPGVEGYDPNRRNGEILGFIQQGPPTYQSVTIPADKFILFRTRVENGNPEGISLLRSAWVPYYYMKNLMAIEAIGYERDANGMLVIHTPSGANMNADDPNSDYNKAAEVGRNVRADEQGALIEPDGWEFKLLSGAGKSFAQMSEAIARYSKWCTMAMLSQFMTLGQDGVGSYSLSSDMTDIAEMVVDATADIIAETFTKQELPRILSMNGFDPEGVRMEHSPAGDTNISIFADFLQKAGDKLTWDAGDEVWLRQMAGLPEKTLEQLEEAREIQDARSLAAQQAFMQRAGQTRQEVEQDDPEDTVEENRATIYGIGSAPDERLRRKMEKAIEQQAAAFLDKQRKRVLKAARQMKGI